MARRSAFLIYVLAATALTATAAEARDRSAGGPIAPAAIAEGAPTLAPFQHVRFCLRYPAECSSAQAGEERIGLNSDTKELLERINRTVNAEIAPSVKGYGSNLRDGWSIAPAAGDCNDYAVTKRHELAQSGVPAKALRLAVVKTPSGLGHLVLVVATTKGDIVLDNLTRAILPWEQTGYQWLKIQSASDARFWHAVQAPALAHADQRIRLARR
jgi:predicted transglutaminase-like cysteine proteinase